MKKLYFALIFCFASCAPNKRLMMVMAAPSISATSGTSGTGNALTINGSGFGTKQRSKPWIWADFQDATINPHSTLSYNTSWGSSQFKTTTASGVRWGVRTSISNWGSGNNTSEFGVPVMTTMAYGSKIRISFWRKATFSYIGNWKWLRIWKGGAGNYPNDYIGDSVAENSDGRLWYTEDLTPVTGTTRKYFTNYPNPNSTWRKEEYLVTLPSSIGGATGSIDILIDGTSLGSDTSFQYDSSARPGHINAIYIQDTKAGSVGATVAAAGVYIDSIYVDDSWGVVQICNGSSRASVTNCEDQPYTSWASGQITINQKLGTLSGSKYVYVCDTSNSCNSTGFLLGSAGAPAPTITSVSPVSGTTAGGTSVTITGTGFVDAPTVTFGGTAATSVVFVNSTSVTCVTPAKTAGIVDVVVTNPDAQASALSDDFYTYVAPATPPASDTACPCAR